MQKGLSQVEKLRWHHIQEKQKSRGAHCYISEFFVGIAQAVHSLLMLCDSPFYIFPFLLKVYSCGYLLLMMIKPSAPTECNERPQHSLSFSASMGYGAKIRQISCKYGNCNAFVTQHMIILPYKYILRYLHFCSGLSNRK